MKILTGTKLSALVLSSLAALAACASTGNEGVEATSTGMDKLRTNIETLKTQVSAAAGSLASVVEMAETDPKPEFERFTKDAKAVESSYKAAESKLADVRADAEKLFRSWAENVRGISDPELQERSEERRMALSGTLDDVVRATQEAMAETKAFVAAQSDIVKYLSQDLTPAGIDAIKDKSKDQTKAASSIEEKLDDVVEAASKAAAEFATATPPPPPAS